LSHGKRTPNNTLGWPLFAEGSHSDLLDFNALSVRYWEKQTFSSIRLRNFRIA